MKNFRVGLLAAIILIISIGAFRFSDHLDSPYIDEYRMRDIGDLFLWNGAETNSPTFLINLNPLSSADSTHLLRLDPSVLYEFKIDTDGDLVADLAYKIAVEGTDEIQDITLYKATFADADTNIVAGDIVATGKSTALGAEQLTVIEGSNGEMLFVGPRRDPFFFDFYGVVSPVALDLQFALGGDGLPSDGKASDTFGPTNITAIVLEIPELKGKYFRSWSTTSIEGFQEDRVGRSSVSAIFLPTAGEGRNPEYYPYGDLKQPYNETKPDEDRKNYSEMFKYRMKQVQVDEAQVQVKANFYLPDVIVYDPNAPQQYPNGRNLAEDAVYWTIKDLNPFLSDSSSIAKPQTNPQDLLDTFPYAANPVMPGEEVSAESECAWYDIFCHLAD